MGRASYSSTRVVYDLTNTNPSEFTDKVLICVPTFAWRVARRFLANYGLRAVNYATSFDDGGYETPDDAQFDDIDASISGLAQSLRAKGP